MTLSVGDLVQKVVVNDDGLVLEVADGDEAQVLFLVTVVGPLDFDAAARVWRQRATLEVVA